MDEQHQEAYLSSEPQLTFLLQVLQATSDSKHDPQVVYPLLAKNIDKLNDNFILHLQEIAVASLADVDQPAMAEYLGVVIINFSNLIQQFQLGNRSKNIEIAITGYEIVANFFTREVFPELWALIQNNLGAAYLYRILGKKVDNLEQAINHCMQALLVRTRYTSPEEWASTKNNLGNAYNNRVIGNRSDNLEQAINCYKQALQVYTRDNFSEQWAITQNNLGEAYRKRIFGARAYNLEQAINCFEQTLLVHTHNIFPEDWATTKNNLGITYLARIVGNSKNNLNQAIDCLKHAESVLTYEAFPEKWAGIQNNLGEAHRSSIFIERIDYLEKSINYYRQALLVYTPDTFPEYWAATQNNLGIAYRNRILKNREENLEEAIDCYHQALRIRTRNAFPKEWAETQNNLGNAYSDLSDIRSDGASVSLRQSAIRCFTETLQIRTCDVFPQGYTETKFNLGLTYQKARNWNSAYLNFTDAINTVELLRGEILSGDEVKQKLAEEYNQIYQYMVQISLELNKPTDAIEYVERSKTRNLVELILTRDRHTIFPAEVVAQLDRLRDEIASGQYELQNATAENPTSLAQHLQQLRQQRNELQDRYLPIGSGFQFNPFRSSLGDRTAIVEFYITTDKLLVFIITKQTQQPIVLSPDLINPNKLANWANSYLKAYSNKKSHWQRRLTTRLDLLAKILHIDEIVEQIPIECDKLILIPHRYLHLLPLHALPITENSSLFDRFPEGVSYAPSCQLLQLAQNRQRPKFTHLFAIQNPTGDLSYTDIEVETIQNYFNTSNLLKQKIATKEAIDNTSLNTVHCAHFSCHGYFNGTEPRKSALLLADSQLNSAPTQSDAENYLSLENGGVLNLNKCLTLDSIFTLNLEQCRLVTLSACETGLIDFRNTSDEYIGLPSGFLYAGASSVVSSLWTVNDLSTAFLMIRFYQNLQNGLTVGLALNQAQLWLKNLTKGDLETWIEENKLPLKPAVRMTLRHRLYKLEDDGKPFESPFYWAAFCASGQ